MGRANMDNLVAYIFRLAGVSHAGQSPDEQLLEQFTSQGDQAAFRALVRRHGPMVLNVCRSILRQEQDTGVI
jgi:hypothetical protein